MGHDIIAGQLSDQQVDIIRERLDFRVYTQELWDNRFKGCGEENFVAVLRRSAYDLYNKVIYRALGAETAYAGCSGNGEAPYFNRVDIKTAYEALPGVVADQAPEIDTTEVDAMVEEIRGLHPEHDEEEWKTQQPEQDEPSSIKDEQQFLMNILTWMEMTGEDRVRIYFG